MNRTDHLHLPVFLDESRTPQPVSAVLEQARQVAAGGREDEAAALFLAATEAILDAGFVDVAHELLRELRERVDANALPARTRARLLAAEGGVFSRLGRRDDARAAFEQMRAIAEELADRPAIAAADHNLANQALYLGDLEEAARLYLASFDARIDLGDYYGATRVVLSLATIAQERGDLAQAESTVAVAEDLLRHMRGVPDLQFAFALARGQLATKRGEFPTALEFFHRALRYARRAGDQTAEVVALQNLGAGYTDVCDYRKAVGWFRRGLRLAESLGAASQLALLHSGLAVALVRAGRWREAMAHFEQARPLYEQVGEVHHAACATADLGALTVEAGDVDRGRRLLTEALSTFRRLGDREWEARVLRNLVEAEYAVGDAAAAEALAQEAVHALPPEARQERAEVLRRAAAAWLAQRPPAIPEAQACFERALAEGDGDPTDQAWQAAQAAAILVDHGGYEAALGYYTRALRVYEEAGEREMVFHVRNDRAIALTHLGRFGEARREYELCLTAAAQLQNRAMELQASFNLGEMAQREGQLDEAIERLERAAELARALADQDAEADALASLGIAFLKAERWDQARDAFERAHDLARRILKPTAEASAIGGLAGVAFAAGRYAEAARLYRRAAGLYRREGDSRHAAEDLGGLVESLAALGRRKELERAAQDLVDLAQQTQLAPHAPEALARSARWWLRRGRIEDAADLYALAVALAGTLAGSDEEKLGAMLAQAVMLTVVHVRAEEVADPDAFYAALLSSLDELEDGLGAAIAPIIDEGRRVGADMQLEGVRDDVQPE